MQEYYRRPRQRNARRAVRNDALVVALTAQVLVCILLLLLVALLKKTDTQRYEGVRQEYNALTAEKPSGSLSETFATLESWLAGLFGCFNKTQEEVYDSEAQWDEPAEEDTPADEAAFRFNYNYLLPAQAEAEVEATLGQGGAFPVDTGGADRAALPPPEGATYARVELDAPVRPPVAGLVTSEFSYRDHPLTSEEDFHTGIDIAAEEGRSILAALPGKVAEAGWSDIYGNFVRVQHAHNLETFYAHCSAILVEEGTQVRQGERIAKVGSTGIATGPHLHFSVIVDGLYTDPYWVLQDNIRVVE